MIRLRKSATAGGGSSSPPEEEDEEDARRARREVDFIRAVISGFLGCYVCVPEILRCDPAEIARLSEKIRPARPGKNSLCNALCRAPIACLLRFSSFVFTFNPLASFQFSLAIILYHFFSTNFSKFQQCYRNRRMFFIANICLVLQVKFLLQSKNFSLTKTVRVRRGPWSDEVPRSTKVFLIPLNSNLNNFTAKHFENSDSGGQNS